MANVSKTGGKPSPFEEKRAPPEKIQLTKEDEEASKVALQVLGGSNPRPSERVEVETTLRPPSDQERVHFAPQDIASQAVSEVTSQEISIHDKWANPAFAKGRSLVDDIKRARGKIEEIKTIYRQVDAETPPTAMRENVHRLLKTGTMRHVDGGKGGVYFLCDEEGKPKYVIKPNDEALLAIHNPKTLASPFLDEDDACAPVQGVLIYEAAQNAELAYRAAGLFGLQEITPHTEIMILEHPFFHDILDGVQERSELEAAGAPVYEKVCTVQSFIEESVDIGSLLVEKMELTPEQIKEMLENEPEKYEELQLKHTPQDISQVQYEKVALLSLLIGEKDGNAGNLICSTAVKEGEPRAIQKIDNAASFPEDNEKLRSGLIWAIHNYRKSLSPETIKTIRNLDPASIQILKDLMIARGKSEASRAALDVRIAQLKEAVSEPSLTIEGLDDKLSPTPKEDE